MADSGFPNVENPFAIPALEFLQLLIVLFPFCILGSAASLVVRYRRSRGVERDQLKLLAFAAAAVAASYLVILLLSIGSTSGNTPGWLGLAQTLVILSFSLIPLAIGVAILRHGLYEIDLIIRKTARYAVLVVLLLSVVVLVLLLAGVAAVGRSGGRHTRGSGSQKLRAPHISGPGDDSRFRRRTSQACLLAQLSQRHIRACQSADG